MKVLFIIALLILSWGGQVFAGEEECPSEEARILSDRAIDWYNDVLDAAWEIADRTSDPRIHELYGYLHRSGPAFSCRGEVRFFPRAGRNMLLIQPVFPEESSCGESEHPSKKSECGAYAFYEAGIGGKGVIVSRMEGLISPGVLAIVWFHELAHRKQHLDGWYNETTKQWLMNRRDREVEAAQVEFAILGALLDEEAGKNLLEGRNALAMTQLRKLFGESLSGYEDGLRRTLIEDYASYLRTGVLYEDPYECGPWSGVEIH